MTLWSPDTCGCRIEIEVSGDNVTHLRSVETCRKHDGKIGQAHTDAVLAHNRAKNILHSNLVENGIDRHEVTVVYDDDDTLRVIGVTPEAEIKITNALSKLGMASKVARGSK